MKTLITPLLKLNPGNLLVTKLFILITGMVLFSYQSSAQNTLFAVDTDVSTDCQSRFSFNPHYVHLGSFAYELSSTTTINNIEVDLSGNFTAADLNNSSGGALIYRFYFPFDNQNPRSIVTGSISVSGPGTYLIPVNFDTRELTVHLALELNENTSFNKFWLRGTIDQSNFNFSPSQSLNGSIPLKTGVTDPFPSIPENIQFQKTAGALEVSWDGPNKFEQLAFYSYKNTTSEQIHIANNNSTSFVIDGLEVGDQVPISVRAISDMPGCDLFVDSPGILGNFWVCPETPAPLQNVSLSNVTNNTAGFSIVQDPSNTHPDPDISYNTVAVMREAGSPRLTLSDGDVLPTSGSAIPSFGNGSVYFGDISIGSGNFIITKTNFLDPNTAYEIDFYARAVVTGTSCSILSPLKRVSFITCPNPPSNPATNNLASAITENSALLTWDNGNGEGRIVVIREAGSSVPNSTLINKNEFIGNPNYSQAPELPGQPGNRVVYSGTNNSVSITGLQASTNYVMYVYEYEGNGGCRYYGGQSIQDIEYFQTLSDDISIEIQAITNRTTTTATANAEINLNNAINITEKGIVWSSSSNEPTTALTTKATAGSGSGSFAAEMTGLTASTQYFVRAYAIAGGTTYYSNTISFSTLEPEPTGHASNFQLTDLTQISSNGLRASFSWSAATDANGYILLYRKDGEVPGTQGVIDGIPPGMLNLPTGTFLSQNQVIRSTSTTQTNGIELNQNYGYLLIPLKDEIENPNTVNYRITGSPVTLTFSTDVNPPLPINFSPANNTTDVPIDAAITVQYNESIQKGSGNIQLINSSNQQIVTSIAVTDSDVVTDGNVLIIDAGTLPANTKLFLTIATGAIEDTEGNPSQAFNGKSIWEFTTGEMGSGDINPPLLVGLTPEYNSSGVPTTGNLRLDFDESIRKGTGNIEIRTVNGNNLVESIPAGSNRIDVFGERAIINYSGLDGNTGYYVNVANGVFTDLSGNDHAGFNGQSNWSFTTSGALDKNAPTISGLMPADNANDVALNTTLSITFNETVQKKSGTIYIYRSSDETLRESISVNSTQVSVNNDIVTIVPLTNLPSSTELYIEVSTGAFEDLTGNGFAGINDATTWSFTTTTSNDGTQPQLISNSLSPSTGAIDVAFGTNLQLTFNDNVLKGSGDILIRNTITNQVVKSIGVNTAQVSINGSQVTINPTTNLPEGRFSVEIPATAFRDQDDNYYPGLLNGSWNFTTVSTPPALLSLSPADGSSDIPLSGTLVLSFDEPITAGTNGFVDIRRLDNNARITSFTPQDPEVVFSGNTVSINYDIPALFYSTEFYIRVSNDFLKDVNENTYQGFLDNQSWNLTFEDQQDLSAPTLQIASFSPADNSSGINADQGLSFSFNEPVLVGTGQITIKDQNNQVLEAINVSNANLEIDGNQVTINRSVSLPEGGVYVEMESGSFTDLAGNEFGGLSGLSSWNFSIIGNPPVPTQFFPSVGSTDVPVNITAIVNFDEPIALGSSGVFSIRRADNNAQITSIARTDPAVDISGNTLSIDIDITGFESTEVYLQIQTGCITDLSGNVLTGLNTNVWNWTTAAAPDVTAPVLLGGTSGLNPTSGSNSVAADANLEITFNENIRAGDGIIGIYRYSDDQLLQGIPASSSSISIIENVVTINPPSNFEDVQMYVRVEPDAFEDLAGNAYAGINSKNTWVFTPVISRPSLISMDPELGATDVPADEPVTFTLQFSEPIQLGSGGTQWIRVRRGDNGAQIYDVPLNDPSLQINGNELKFDVVIPEIEGLSEVEAFIQIAASTIEDLNGNTLTGSLGAVGWTSFYIERIDTTPPFINLSSVFPADNATDVPYNTNLSFEFSETVVKNNGHIIIKDAFSPNPVIRTIHVSSPEVTVIDNIVTIDLADDLPERQMFVEVELGAFKDLAGNIRTQDPAWQSFWLFTTLIDPLQVVDFFPPNGTTNIQINEPVEFEVTFSHPVEPNTLNPGDILIRTNSGTIIETIPVDDPGITINGNKLKFEFTVAGSYHGFNLYAQVQSGIVQDVDGISKNTQLAPGLWNFTMEEATAPEPVAFSPADNSTNVTPGENLIITFNENIEITTSFFARLRSLSQSIVEEFDENHPGISVSGNQLTINPSSDLDPGESYWVNLFNNSVADSEGTGNVAFTDNTTWNFIVASDDNDAPVILNLSPSDNATNVQLDENLTIEFDELVFIPDEAGTELIRIRKSDHSIVETLILPSARVAGYGTSTITIDPTASFEEGESYYVQFFDAFEDASGNIINNFTDENSWNFTTLSNDTSAPVIQSSSPVDNETGVAENVTITITFSEPVGPASPIGVFLREEGSNSIISSSISISGSVLTINPDENLTNGQGYYVDIQNNQIYDQAGNAFAGLDEGDYNFLVGTVDNTPPTVTSFTPADDATDIAVDIGTLTMTFSENIQQGNAGSKFRLRRNDGSNQIVQEFEVGTSQVSFGTNTVTLNNVNTLDYNTSFWIQNNFGVTVYDLGNNPLANWNTTDFWNFTTEQAPDMTAPSIVSVSPSNGSGNVPFNANLVIEFDEDIQFLSNSSFLIKLYDTTINLDNILYTSDEVSISGNTITINPNDDFNFGDHYWIRINPGTIGDMAGNSFDGYTDQSQWNFTIEKADQTISIDPIADKVTTDVDFDVTASTTSGLTLDYTILEGPATISGNTVSLTGETGTVVIEISQAGNDTYNPASAQVSFNISDPGKTNQTITFDAIPGKTFGDEDFTLTASASSGLDVSFEVVSGPITLSGSTVSIDGAGEVTIRALQSGDEDFNPAPAVEQTFMIEKADQSITFENIEDKTMLEDPLSLNATSSSGLDVSYTVVSGPASLSGNEITFTGEGTIVIEASQDGNENYNTATPVQQSFDVNKVNQTISFEALQDKTFGDADFDLTATTSSGLPVTFSIVSGPASVTGNTLSITGAGLVMVEASQNGNEDYGAAISVEQSFTVAKAPQTITIESIEDKNVDASDFEVVITTSSGNTPTLSISGPATLSGTTVSLTGTTGEVTITAELDESNNYLAASESLSFEVFPVAQVQTITFGSLSDKTFGDPSFELNAAASSGLAVSYSSSNESVATISGTSVTIVGAGTTTITASQPGNVEYNAATPVDQELVVAKADQTITFDALAESMFGDPTIDLSATASSDLAISYESSNTAIATVSGSTLTIVGAGTTTITASQPGNDNYNAATPVEQVLVVNKATQTIDFAAIDDQNLSDGSLTLSASVTSGLEVTFTIDNGPATLDASTLTFTAAGEVTVTAQQAGNDNYEAATPVSQTFTIIDDVPDPQTIDFAAIADVTYGDVVDLSATASSGLDVSYTIVDGPADVNGTQVSFSGIGTVIIEATQSGNANFLAADPVQQSFEVLPASLEVTANDQTTVFNEAIPALTYSISGFVNGEDESMLTTAPTVTTNAATGDDAGTYAITVSGGEAANYAFNYTDGILTIEKAQATITLSDLEQEADGTAKLPTVTTEPAGLNYTITFDGSADAPLIAGEYQVEVVIDETNYQGSATDTFVIDEAENVLGGLADIELKVYPNPVADYLNIEGNTSRVRLVTTQGKILFDITVVDGNASLDIRSLSSGVYLLSITDGNGKSEIRRIIKQ